jgi:hypothetical protein
MRFHCLFVRDLRAKVSSPSFSLLFIRGVQILNRDCRSRRAGRFKTQRIMAHPLSPSKASTRQQNNPVFGLCARFTIHRHGTRPGTERYRNHDDSLSAPGQFALRQARQYRSNWNRSIDGWLSVIFRDLLLPVAPSAAGRPGLPRSPRRRSRRPIRGRRSSPPCCDFASYGWCRQDGLSYPS